MLTSNILRLLDPPFMTMGVVPSYNERKRKWRHPVHMPGFEAGDMHVKIDKDDKGDKVVIHAKSGNGDDFSESRKTVRIPENVDVSKIQTYRVNDGIVLEGLYKDEVDLYRPFQFERQDNWNGLWNELDRMNTYMHHMVNDEGMKLPRTEYNKGEGDEPGKWKVQFNIGNDFNSEDIDIRMKDDMLQLNAKKEVKSENGTSIRHLHESVSIPEGVEQDKLKCEKKGNQLIIEGPTTKVPEMIEENKKGKSIPILNEEKESMLTN